jgi:lipoate-protein ligase B
MDLAPFLSINPCGYARLRMTQVRDQDANFINFDHFKQQYLAALLAELDCFAADAE